MNIYRHKNMKLDISPLYIKNTFKIYVKYTKVKSITKEPKEKLNALNILFFNKNF
jgi:hypothetical protein